MLKPGDKVIRNGLYYVPEEERGRVYTVAGTPFAPDDGPLYVKLEGEGVGECVLVDGLTLIASAEEDDAEREFSAVLKEEEAEAADAPSTVRFTNGEMRIIAEAMRDGIMYNEIMKDEMRSRPGMEQSVRRFQETVCQYTRVMQNHGLKELIDYGV